MTGRDKRQTGPQSWGFGWWLQAGWWWWPWARRGVEGGRREVGEANSQPRGTKVSQSFACLNSVKSICKTQSFNIQRSSYFPCSLSFFGNKIDHTEHFLKATSNTFLILIMVIITDWLLVVCEGDTAWARRTIVTVIYNIVWNPNVLTFNLIFLVDDQWSVTLSMSMTW